MRILFIAARLPYPPRSGAAIRNLSLLKGLAGSHEVTLLALGEPADLASAGPLEGLCRAVEVVSPPPPRRKRERLLDLARPEPDLARRLRSPALAARARAILADERFDVVHLGELAMVANWPARWATGSAAVILDDHNAEYVLQRRAFENECRLGGDPVGALYSLLQWRKLRRYEAEACRRADGVVAVSAADRQALSRLAPEARLAVVPNAIDVRDYQPRLAPPSGPATLVFTGTLDYRPNVDAVVWFCREVLPLVRARAPEARLWLVGRNPTTSVRRLATLPGVEVVGEVEDDRSYLAGAHVCLVPMRVGGGVRLKILQAMAAGVPVVATTLGCEGLAATPDEHLLVADQPADLARAILDLLRSPERGAALAARARELVEARYDWRVVVPRLEEFYAATVAAKQEEVRRESGRAPG